MSKLQILSVAALAAMLGAAGPALACGPSFTAIESTGQGNSIMLETDGWGQSASIGQDGRWNFVDAEMSGACDTLIVRQDGSFNDGRILVDGSHNGVGLVQAHGAEAALSVFGRDNGVIVSQSRGELTLNLAGRGNDVVITQR